MSIHKHDFADLRKRYPLHVEVGFIAALAVLILAFNVEWSPKSDFELVLPDREEISFDEIKPTDPRETPPPPPKPRIPVPVPDHSELSEDEIDFGQQFENLIEDTPPPTEDATEKPEPEPEIFVIVEEMPEPIGGMRAVYERVKEYPEVARKAGVEGRVVVQFLVDKEGNVHDPVVLRGVGAGLDELAVKAIQNTKFKPGKQRGKPVRVKMSLSVLFKLK